MGFMPAILNSKGGLGWSPGALTSEVDVLGEFLLVLNLDTSAKCCSSALLAFWLYQTKKKDTKSQDHAHSKPSPNVAVNVIFRPRCIFKL